MKREILQRLERLEATVARRPTHQQKADNRLHMLLFYSIAVYLGTIDPEASPMHNHLRALGYDNGYDFKMALEGRESDYNDRWAAAVDRLLAQFGVSRSEKWEKIEEALARMEEGLPDDFKMQLRNATRS